MCVSHQITTEERGMKKKWIMQLSVMVTGRNTPASCSTMSRLPCLERVCTKNVGFNSVQSEPDASVKWCNCGDSLQEKHTSAALWFLKDTVCYQSALDEPTYSLFCFFLLNSYSFFMTSPKNSFVLSELSAEQTSYDMFYIQQWHKIDCKGLKWSQSNHVFNYTSSSFII